MMFKHIKLCFSAVLAATTFSCLMPQSASAQTTTTYTYDANGRMISAASSAGQTETVTYDAAGNITNAKSTGGSGGGGGGNSPPVCTNQVFISLWPSFSIHGPSFCTDADGDTIIVTNVTDPAGATTATFTSYMIVQFANLQSGANVTTVTVSDGNGGTATYTITVYR